MADTTIIGTRRTRVAVVEGHEILRYGLVACLAQDRLLDVSVATVDGLQEFDIAVVSSELAREQHFDCPIIVYGDGAGDPRVSADGNDVAGALHRGTLTVAQLHATVHAAVAGLRVVAQHAGRDEVPVLRPRELRLIELLADGYSTREIAERMSYAERTIKKLITDLGAHLGARSRAQIVAQAIRRGII
jgi:DNA-binding NarL/FixJ family response regulator